MESTHELTAPKRTAAGRVLALLDAFTQGGSPLTLSEISRQAGLSLTTTHRLVKEVLQWGGLELDESGRYRLSCKILGLASTSRAMVLRERALPHLMELHSRTGMSVHLAVRDRDEVMYIEALRAHPNYTGRSRIGGHFRLHVTATGLVLLAHEREEFIEEYLNQPLKRYTEHTIADADELRTTLHDVRQQGYAVAHQFVSPTAGAVGAPIVGLDGEVTSSLGLTYHVNQVNPSALVDLVRVTATRISRALREKQQLDPRTVDFNRRHAGML
ncbi:IclR family transcriptional regulator [Nesterenkonia flava]|uniref:IclR family transcriptional regulator n=1 Tax=Nesterenkonia flava TaxID=469799 RepID=A0ABU1FQU2_9MICC|nr:IclR family transcriptional regulator [Nesterenkonia flava]MDR5710568.1 IclR family transcriptional regulator [Nesterenkonia flava]